MRKNHCSSCLDLYLRAAALAAAVDDLLVGEHGLVVGAPLDRGLLAVREPGVKELQEDPLRPAVVARFVRGELARPVDRDPPRAELALEGRDRLGRRVARVDAGLDRVVLGGQAEGVVAHRVQHAVAEAPVEVRDRVADGVDLQVPDVGLAAGVGQHLQHVGLRRLATVSRHPPPPPAAAPPSLPCPGGSLETSQVRSAAHTACQRGSISRGS